MTIGNLIVEHIMMVARVREIKPGYRTTQGVRGRRKFEDP
jgi:hypothetical protein